MVSQASNQADHLRVFSGKKVIRIGQPVKEIGGKIGSGFALDENLIVTNEHVAPKEATVVAVDDKGKVVDVAHTIQTTTASNFAGDGQKPPDLAVLKLDRDLKNIRTATLAPFSQGLKQGDELSVFNPQDKTGGKVRKTEVVADKGGTLVTNNSQTGLDHGSSGSAEGKIDPITGKLEVSAVNFAKSPDGSQAYAVNLQDKRNRKTLGNMLNFLGFNPASYNAIVPFNSRKLATA